MERVPLTDRQRETLVAIKKLTDKKGYPPTLKEISEELGIASHHGAHDTVNRLKAKGWISRDFRNPRGIVILALPDEVAS
jgi:repressor LexA